MPEQPYPDLELDICGKIGDAILRELRSDTALATVFGDRIFEGELERLAVDRAGTFQVPTLLVAPGPTREERLGNDGYTTLVTTFDLVLLTAASGATGTDRWLRQRICHAIKKRLMREQGTLRDGAGLSTDERLTEALKRFERLDFAGRLRADASVIVTVFRVSFASDIDELDRNFIQ